LTDTHGINLAAEVFVGISSVVERFGSILKTVSSASIVSIESSLQGLFGELNISTRKVSKAGEFSGSNIKNLSGLNRT